MDLENLKSWPFEEAKKLIQRKSLENKELCNFQTGYGPSGLPHIGTFAEVLRTSMVIKAFKKISKKPTNLFVFSDDMDGLRKVPENIPNKNLISEHLHKSLSSIPDPFEKFSSFSEYNNSKLREFLNRFEFVYDFKSSTTLYKSGFFNNGLIKILENYEKIRDVILPTLGKERRKTYSPFLPLCKHSGKVLEVKIENIDLNDSKIEYYCPMTKKIVSNSILNGECKLQWKVDWAMRWFVLDIDYEMNGKDLIESFQLSSKINKIIGGTPPNNLTYELFLDQRGEKISKSIGNGISVDQWLEFSTKESLELFMYQAPRKAKRLFFDVIPKTTDEYLKFKSSYTSQSEVEKLNNPLWFINEKDCKNLPDGLTFNMILNLASVCNAENSDILWGFINSYYPDTLKNDNDFLGKLLELAVTYYKKFILPNKKYRIPTETERQGFLALLKELENISINSNAQDIQNIIYQIGKDFDYPNLRDWFGAFYEVILGQKEGPRLGSFIKFYGLDKTIDLIKDKLQA